MRPSGSSSSPSYPFLDGYRAWLVRCVTQLSDAVQDAGSERRVIGSVCQFLEWRASRGMSVGGVATDVEALRKECERGFEPRGAGLFKHQWRQLAGVAESVDRLFGETVRLFVVGEGLREFSRIELL